MKSSRLRALSSICLLVVLFASRSFAFDGERRGFILGFGLGFGQTAGVNNDKKIGVITDFKIGHGFSNTTQIYWTAKSSFFTADDYSGRSRTYLSGCGAIGVSQFLNQRAPSAYFAGGIGYSSFGKLESDYGDPDYNLGIGFFSGFGYEFSPHWSLEIDLIAGSPSIARYGYYTDVHLSIWTIKVSVNTLAY